MRRERVASFLAGDEDPRLIPVWRQETKAAAAVRERFRMKARIALMQVAFTEDREKEE